MEPKKLRAPDIKHGVFSYFTIMSLLRFWFVSLYIYTYNSCYILKWHLKILFKHCNSLYLLFQCIFIYSAILLSSIMLTNWCWIITITFPTSSWSCNCCNCSTLCYSCNWIILVIVLMHAIVLQRFEQDCNATML